MAEKQTEKDTLWSWIFLASVTVIFFLEFGMMKSLSVLLPTLREQLSSHTWIIGSCISIVYGWGYVIGIGSGALLKKLGVRATLAVSGSLTCLGLIVCACATNAQYFLCGLLLAGFIFVQENTVFGMLSHYFDKYFATSLSILYFGGNIAIMVVPPIMQLLLETYGWRGAMVLLSAISFHSVLCSVIIKGEHMNLTEQKESKQEEMTSLLSNLSSHSKQRHFSVGTICEKIFEGRNGFCKKIIDNMGVTLLTNISIVVCVLMPGFVWGYTMTGWFIYIVSYALSIGATMREAALVSTCGGIGLTLTRLVMPLINNCVHFKHLIYASLLLASVSLGLGAIWGTLPGLYISSAIFGVSSCVLGTSVYIAARAYTSDDDYVHAVAWLHLMYGFASILTGSVSGIIYDVTGSFKISFAVLAAVPLLSIIPFGLNDLWTRMAEIDKIKL